MNQIKLQIENEFFIKYILRGDENSDIRCSMARLTLKGRFIHCAEDNYLLTRRQGLIAFERALAQVLVDWRLGRVDITKTNLEDYALYEHGIREMNLMIREKMMRKASERHQVAAE